MFDFSQLLRGLSGGGGMPGMSGQNNPLSMAMQGGGNMNPLALGGEGKPQDPNQMMQQNLRQQLISQMLNPQGTQQPTPGPSMGMPTPPPPPPMPMGAPQGQRPPMQGNIAQLLATSMPNPQGGMLQRRPFLGGMGI